MNHHGMGRTAAKRLGALGALGLAITLLSAPSYAGSCTTDTRDMKGASIHWHAHTVMKNRTTNTVFQVEIDRDGQEKEKSTIESGDDADFLANMDTSTNEVVSFTVTVTTSDGSDSVACVYQINNKTGANKTKWELVTDPICDSADTLCDNCTISCEKSWNQDKDRWNTDFTIAD